MGAMISHKPVPMVIDLIANDGSPIGVIPPDIYGKGVGGAELAMMSLMETFADRGHKVTVYNDPSTVSEYNGVQYEHRRHFNSRGHRDVLIVFRSPNPLLVGAYSKIAKVWWSTDQYTVGSFKALSEMVDFCVTISPYHTNYHLKHYGVDPKKIGHIDIGVRLQDYDERVEKIKNRLIYCSVPDRGLAVLHSSWPLIQREIPGVTLTITSDYTLWGVTANDGSHRLNWAGMTGVNYLGNVSRAELVKLQMQAELMAYPCTYEELFCVSVAECQVAGALPFTTSIGALPTTNQFGIVVSGNLHNPATLREAFVDRVVSLLKDERDLLESKIKHMQTGARLRFDWNRIAEKWEYLFQHGRLPE